MVMYRNLCLLLFLFLSTLSDAHATDVAIKGLAPDFANRDLYFITYHDFIARQPLILKEVTCDDQGNFQVQFEDWQTGLVRIQSGAWYAEFYLESGRSYTIRLDKPKENVAITFDQNPLNISFETLEVDDPNLLMQAFNQRYNALFGDVALELAVKFGKGANEALIPDSGEVAPDDFVTQFERFQFEMRAKLSPTTDPFTSDLLRGALGRLDLSLGRNRKSVDSLWLTELPDLKNPELTALFIDIHAMTLAEIGLSAEAFKKGLRDGQLQDCIDALSKGEHFRDDRERILFTLHEIKLRWAKSSETRGRLKTILEQVQADNDFVLGALAGRMLEELVRATTQAERFLPSLTLIDHTGERFSLRDLDGDLVYFSVIHTGMSACEREMMTMQQVFKKFGNQIRFVTLVMDESNDDLNNYLADHRDRDWLFLKGGGHPMLRHALRLKTVPVFFLIDQEGKLIYDNTRMPSEGISDTMLKLVGSGKKKIKVWD